ncbi:hypothetical protein DRN89_03165 [archaeon]|nr:MAG: hypothetical protein DRN89_03165 [archaeon]
MLKVDLHVHTKYSDGDSLERIIYYARRCNLNGLAITDHNTIKGALSIAKLTRDLIIMPGIELKTDVGHVLLLGVKEKPSKTMDYIELYEWSMENNIIIVLAHPVATLWRTLSRIRVLERYKPHAIEVLNSTYPLYSVATKLSEFIAKSLGLSGVAGSDAHRAYQVGLCFTLINSNPEVEDVLESIRRGRVKPLGSPTPLPMRLELMMGFLSDFFRKEG